MSFKHFILTRFNTTLISEPVSIDREGERKRYDPSWLEHRVNIFEKVCVPTIKNQTNKGFKWIVLFGENTPDTFIAELANKHEFIPVKGSQWQLNERLDRTIRSLAGDSSYIITTNVDSDDGISLDFINEVQSQFLQKEMAIYVDRGVRWNLNDNTYLSTTGTRNPFPSIVEPVTNGAFRTVIAYSHGQLDGYYGTVVHINNKVTRWLMGIHGDNLVNRMNPVSEDKPKPFSEVSSLFGL